MKPCPTCGRNVSPTAKACPGCGEDFTAKQVGETAGRAIDGVRSLFVHLVFLGIGVLLLPGIWLNWQRGRFTGSSDIIWGSLVDWPTWVFSISIWAGILTLIFWRKLATWGRVMLLLLAGAGVTTGLVCSEIAVASNVASDPFVNMSRTGNADANLESKSVEVRRAIPVSSVER